MVNRMHESLSETPNQSTICRGHQGDVLAVAWSPDGRYLVSGSRDYTVRWWDQATGKESLGCFSGACVDALAFSPDGEHLVSSGLNNTVYVWDRAEGRVVLTYQGHDAPVYGTLFYGLFGLAYSANGCYVASASLDRTVQVWEPTTGQPCQVYRGHTKEVNDLTWSPDGSFLASASADGTVQVWEALSGRPVTTYRGHTGWIPVPPRPGQGKGTDGRPMAYAVHSVEWVPGGEYIASAGHDGTVQVWEALSGRPVTTYRGQIGHSIASIAVSPDGSSLAIGEAGPCYTIRRWEYASNTEWSVYRERAEWLGGVRALAWSPDGTHIAAGCDRTVRVMLADAGVPA